MKNFTTIIVLVAILVSCFQPVYAVDDCKLYGYCTEDTSNEIIETKDKKINDSKSIVWSSSNINLAVNGEKISFPDQKPMLSHEGRTYVPVRFLAEALGAEVDWDDNNETVIIKNYFIEGRETRAVHYLKIGESKIVTAQYNNGFNNPATHISVFYIDVFPVILNQRTMLPFRHISEILGARVFYDQNTNTAHCEKIDLSEYKSPDALFVVGETTKGRLNGSSSLDNYPILSTVLQEYFADELNKVRREHQQGAVDACRKTGGSPEYCAYFDKDTSVKANNFWSDVCVWAAFDHNLHPEFAPYDAKGYLYDGSMHIFSNMLPAGGYKGIPEAVQKDQFGWVDRSKTTFDAWVPFHKYHKDKYGIDLTTNVYEWDDLLKKEMPGVKTAIGYSENAMAFFGSTFGLVRENKTKSKKEAQLLKLWGVETNGETKFAVYDEEGYRFISKFIIDLYKTSTHHYNTMVVDDGREEVGIAIFGEYSYMNIGYYGVISK